MAKPKITGNSKYQNLIADMEHRSLAGCFVAGIWFVGFMVFALGNLALGKIKALLLPKTST